jgi:hypothetical protein
MAGIFDDLRDKGNGILSSLNDFLYNSKSTLPQDSFTDPDTSMMQYENKNTYDQRILDKPPVPVVNKNPNAQVPNPQNKGENTFLGAVGEYFNNAQKTWKDKGGFDALMSNPQFGIGLSLLQQASEGKTIGASALKAMVDGGVISNAYAKKIAAKGKLSGPVTQAQMDQVRSVLSASGLGGKTSLLQKLKDIGSGESSTAKQDMSIIEIAKEANSRGEALSAKGQKPNIDDLIREVTKEYIDNGMLQVNRSDLGITGERGITLKSDTFRKEIIDGKKIPKDRQKQLGGPVTKGTSYLVGEVGPEVFIPKESGKIVSYDDSKIINLLLESNPQLKSVSPARVEKILRNRFPDYFE